MRLVSVRLDPKDIGPVASLGLLTLKPMLWALNVDEDKLQGLQCRRASSGSPAGLNEIMALESEEERIDYLRSLAWRPPALTG